jgi:CheY-like chemotaxis protein
VKVFLFLNPKSDPMTKKNILLVDDDKIFNFLSEKTISSLGLANEVHFASHGEQALDILQRYLDGELQRPDIIFLDIDMPVMNGYEFIEAFANLDIPDKHLITIVILTSSANPTDIERAKSLGIKYYLNKPLTKDEIKKLISSEFSYPVN